MNGKQFLQALAEKAGIPKDDPEFVSIIDLPVVAQLVLPDTLANKIDSKLFNEQSARNNPELLKAFTPVILAASDNQINELLSDFDDTIKSEFSQEKNTPKKIKMLADKIKSKNQSLIEELQKASSSKDSKERIDKLTAEITKLNSDLSAKDAEWQGKLKAKEQENADKHLGYAVKSHLATKKYADDKKPMDLNVEFANFVLQRELAEKKAKIVLKEDGSLSLKNSENPDLEYMENHRPVNFGDFADKALANHNMLFVSGKSPQAPPVNAPPITPGTQQPLQEVLNLYDEQIAAFNGQPN